MLKKPDPMNLEQLTDRISTFVQTELLHGSDKQIDASEDLLIGGHIDSMGIMRLVSFLEEELAVNVPPEDVTIDHFQCIGKIAEYVHAKLADS